MNQPELAQDPHPSESPKSRRIGRSRLVQVGILVALVIAILLLLRACGDEVPDHVDVVAAGDMVCDPKDPGIRGGKPKGNDCRFQEVSDLALAMSPYAFLGLGDYVHEVPKKETYNGWYHDSWGRMRDITLPALGNQELKVHEANTFRDYFGDRAGPETGYWSTDVGRWHVVVINSNCTVVVGGCATGSVQQEWLAEDLMENQAKCTLALMHHPRWSTGIAGPNGRTGDLYQTLYQQGVDLVLSGHEADYERFPRLNPDGVADPVGVRQFVVGTGGQSVYAPEEGAAPWRNKGNRIASEFRQTDHHGVLKLSLNPESYSWEYHGLDLKEPIMDAGTDNCT